MALTRKLVMSFRDNEGATKSVTINNAASNVDGSAAKTVMDTIIANTDIFETTYLTKIKAQLVVTEGTDLDINE